MKKLFLLFITGYQKIISPLFHQLLGQRSFCRYSPTCSTYTREVIEHYGVVKGSLLALNRFLHCQPFVYHSALISQKFGIYRVAFKIRTLAARSILFNAKSMLRGIIF